MPITLRSEKGTALTWDEHDATHQGLADGSNMEQEFNPPGNITAGGNITGANLSGTNTGDQTFEELTGDFTGHAGEAVVVNGTENGVEFQALAGGIQWIRLGSADLTQIVVVETAKFYTRLPACTVLAVRSSLKDASTSGLVIHDIFDDGVSILGVNKLSIDANEKTSTSAATPTSIANPNIADDSEITVDVVDDGDGTNAAGDAVYLKVRLT